MMSNVYFSKVCTLELLNLELLNFHPFTLTFPAKSSINANSIAVSL